MNSIDSIYIDDLNQQKNQMGHQDGVDFNFRGHNLENDKRDIPFQIFDNLNKNEINE